MNDRTALLLDKNILQGWPLSRLNALAEQYTLLMPDVLFFEMISTDPAARAKCFGSLAPTKNPIVLVDHIGQHLKYELEYFTPMGKPSQHPLVMDYRFHPKLRDADYVLPADVAARVSSEKSALRIRVTNFIERAGTIEGMILQLTNQGMKRPPAFEQIRREVSDIENVRTFLKYLKDPNGEALPFDPSGVDESSALLRHMQVMLLFAIDAWERYGSVLRLEAELSENLYDKLEHDVLDAEYLSLAVLEGAFATQEQKLRMMFKQLRPNGLLVP